LIFSSLLLIPLIFLSICHNCNLPTSLFSKRKSIDDNRKVFTASIFCPVSSGEDTIFPSQISISLSLNFAVLSLTVLRAAIGAPRCLIDSAVVKFGIAFPQNWKSWYRKVRHLFSLYMYDAVAHFDILICILDRILDHSINWSITWNIWVIASSLSETKTTSSA
jgi:hypothetical protein